MRYSNYLFISIFCLFPSTCFSFFNALTNYLFHKKTSSQLQSSKRETAIKNLKKKQIDTPLDPIVNYNLGIAQYQEGSFESASNNFERAVSQGTHYPELQAEASFNAGTAYHAHAASLYEKKELDQALIKIDQALSWYSRLFASDKNQALIAQKQEHAEQLKKKIEEEKKNQEQEKNKDNKDNKQQDKQENKNNQQQNQNQEQNKQNQDNADQKDQQNNQDQQDQQENEKKSDSDEDQSNKNQNKQEEKSQDQNQNESEKEKQQNQEENKNKSEEKEEKTEKTAAEQEQKKEQATQVQEHETQNQPKKETLHQKRMRALIESLDQQEGDIQKEYLKRKTSISSQPTARGQKTW